MLHILLGHVLGHICLITLFAAYCGGAQNLGIYEYYSKGKLIFF